jgi:hypothetical protein
MNWKIVFVATQAGNRRESTAAPSESRCSPVASVINFLYRLICQKNIKEFQH